MEYKRKLRREGEKLRREKLNQKIKELADEVPWLPKSEHRPEKTRILKLAASYLRFHHGLKKKMLIRALPPWLQDEISQFSLEKITDGFLLVVSRGGNIIYVSETISEVLGHSQLDLIGSSIYTLLHKDDKILFDNQFSNNNSKFYVTQDYRKSERADVFPPVHSDHDARKSFCVRMESIAEQGEERHFETVQISGHVSFIDSANQNPSKAAVTKNTWLVAIGKRIKAEMSLENSVSMSPIRNANEWITQHGLDAKLWYQDQRVATILGVLARDHIGTSVYQHICKEDLKYVAISHMKIMTDFESPSTIFRLRNIFDECEYVESRSIVVNDAWTKKPLFIISLNCLLEKVDGEERLKLQAESYKALISVTQKLKLQDSGSENSQIGSFDSKHADNSSGMGQIVSPSLSNNSAVLLQNPASNSEHTNENETSDKFSVTEVGGSACYDATCSRKLPMLKSLLINDEPIDSVMSEENTTNSSDSVKFPLVTDNTVRERKIMGNSTGFARENQNEILHIFLSENSDKTVVENAQEKKTYGRDKLLRSCLFHDHSDNLPHTLSPHIEANHFHAQISQYFSLPPSVREYTPENESTTLRDCNKLDDAQTSEDSSINEQSIRNSETQEPSQEDSEEETDYNSRNNVMGHTEHTQDKKTWHVTMALHSQLRQKFAMLQHNMQEQHREINDLQHKLTGSTMHVSEHDNTGSSTRRSQILHKMNLIQNELFSQRSSLLSLQEEANEKYQDFVSMTTVKDDIPLTTGTDKDQDGSSS